MSVISANLQAVLQRMQSAQYAAGRADHSVRLIAASKMFPAVTIAEAMAAGQIDFGENYLQEAMDKMVGIEALMHLKQANENGSNHAVWHFIGPIQSNKTRTIAEHFDWVHTVDRLKIAQRLSEQRPAHRAPLKILIQVNISHEASKSGVMPDQLTDLVRAIVPLPRLQFCGLMAIPEAGRNVEEQSRPFSALRQLADQLNASGLRCPELSMGMSDDLEAAILEGATMIRIGTAIFGSRRP